MAQVHVMNLIGIMIMTSCNIYMLVLAFPRFKWAIVLVFFVVNIVAMVYNIYGIPIVDTSEKKLGQEL